MSTNAEIKRAILKGVLEDNLDLPKPARRRPRMPANGANPAPRGMPRARWSPAPLLIAGFLFASGAAFPRLTGDLTAIVPGIQDHAVMAAPLRVQESRRFGDTGEGEQIAAALRFDVAGYQADQSPVSVSLKVSSEVAFALPDPVPAAESLPGQAAKPVHTIYKQMIDDGSIPVADLFGLKVSTIVIDPGHGGVDPGTTGPNGLTEKELTLDIARRLRDKLESFGTYRVLLTREEDVKIPLKDRVEFAREHKADLFISIHFNSLPVESVNLVETFYFGPQADKRVLELAEKENAGSGYGVGGFRQVIERISDTLKTQESKDLAALLQRNLYTNLKRESRKLTNAGIKTAPFVVLLGSDVPSVLAEVSCLSNELEARNLETSEYREQIAGYLTDGIVEYLDQKHNTNQNHIAKGELKHVANQQER